MGLLEQTVPYTTPEHLAREILTVKEELNGRIAFGHPETTATDTSNGRLLNIEGSWVVMTLTAATGVYTCTHNLNIPTTTIGANSAKPANVRWLMMGAEYGIKDGTSAAPADPGAFTVQLIRMINGTITADSINIRYSVSGFTPSATEPVTVTLFFTKALN